MANIRSLALLVSVLLLGTTAALAPASTGAAGAAPWQDLVSNPVLAAAVGAEPPRVAGAVGLDGEVLVTRSPYAQNEPALAVNPLDPTNLIAGWNDYDIDASGAYVWTGIAHSKDGGATWTDRIMKPHPKDPSFATWRSVLGIPGQYSGDPMVAFNGLGVALYAGMYFSSGGGYQSALVASPSFDGGETQFPVPIVAAHAGRGGVPAGLTDKPWMRGDPGSGWFYMCWTHFGGGPINIWFTSSGDGYGLTWTPPKRISSEGGVQGCDIGVGPDGEVYVTYVDFTFGLTSGGVMRIMKSTDHGVTFTPAQTIGTVLPLSMPNSNFRYAHFPRIAVDPTSGDVYVAWPEGRPNAPATGADIVLVKSTDGGATWSPKVRVNNDAGPATQFFPAIGVGTDGKVTVGFYDRRDDPANRYFSYYLAESTDGGATFPVQYAASPSRTDGLNPGWWFIGDYTDIAVGSDDKARAVWAAAPAGDQNIYAH